VSRIVVIGATGRTGRRVVALLCGRGHNVTALGLSAAKLGALDRRAAAHTLDVSVPGALAPLLASADPAVDVIVSCAHARFTGAILDALPAQTQHSRPVRLVLMGSVRRYLAIPDRDGSEIAEGERRLYASGRPGVMLHASMIFGAPDDGNVSRILGSLARWPKFLPIVLPLPDGGRRLVQPIFIDDVAASVVAAVEQPSSDGPPLVLAGPAPIAYRRLIEHCAAALGRRAAVLPVPLGLLATVAATAARAGIKLPLNAAELRRAAQDKSFDVAPMITRLGVTPIEFAAGLARMIGQTPPR
jgi:nucleoside-diphosphate-sugar epimerase